MAEEKILLLGSWLNCYELSSELVGPYGYRLRVAGYNVNIVATREELSNTLPEADLVIMLTSNEVKPETCTGLVPKPEDRRKTVIWCTMGTLERLSQKLAGVGFAHIAHGHQPLENLLQIVRTELELVRNIGRPKEMTVSVSTTTGHVTLYVPGESMELTPEGVDQLTVVLCSARDAGARSRVC